MLFKGLGKSLGRPLAGVALAVIALLAGCASPCDAPGRLCAPIQANTSPPPPRAVQAARPAPQAPPPAAEVLAVDLGSARSQAAPPLATGPLIRIGLMLPLRSATLGVPAEALRAGFMAAYERERDGIAVDVIETGDTPQEALDAYAAAVGRNDVLVGPLARSAVAAVASSPVVSKPTIALNHPELRGGGADIPLPQQMLVMGLSIEDEARQAANWASAEQPGATALIVSGASAWQRRIANAFAAQWKQRGQPYQLLEVPASNGYLAEAALGQLKARIEADRPALLFAALDADQVRQLRAAVGTSLPCYGTSSVNPGTEPGLSNLEMDGLRLLDMPWEVQPDHAAAMVYPRWIGTPRTLDMDRLYALGIDAYRVAREIALHPGASFRMDGVTGRLQVSFGKGAPRFERILPAAVYQGGAFQLVGGTP